ncbi:MAG TPA: hypothetical protein VGF59_29970, partial [Bryobacteraceae bacterium]
MKRVSRLPLFAVWAATLLAYSNSFTTPLLFDSNSAIVADPRVWSATSENVRAIVSEDYWYRDRSSGLYRPLTKLSYLFNYAVLGSGTNPGSYHLVNFLLHLANVTFVYLLVSRLPNVGRTPSSAPDPRSGLSSPSKKADEGVGRGPLGPPHSILGAATAALWGVHPVLTESVTNVVGRADLLATFGVLAGLLCYIRSASARIWLLPLSAAAAIGIFSKESAVVLLAAMVLYDVAFGGASWRRRVEGYAAAVVPFLLYFYLRSRVQAGLIDTNIAAFVQNPLAGADFWTARVTAIGVIGRLMLLVLWPARLSVDYSYNQIPLVTGAWALLASVAVCVAALAAFVCYRRSRRAFFFLAFAAAALVPTSNLLIPIGTIMAERFLYVPSIGLIACLVLALGSWPAARRRLPAIAGVLALALGARTWARNLDWTNGARLWTSAVEACPNSYMTHLALASARMSGPDPASVDREFDRSLAIVDPLSDQRNLTAPYSMAGTWYRL